MRQKTVDENHMTLEFEDSAGCDESYSQGIREVS
jgi:hypothetical protein